MLFEFLLNVIRASRDSHFKILSPKFREFHQPVSLVNFSVVFFLLSAVQRDLTVETHFTVSLNGILRYTVLALN